MERAFATPAVAADAAAVTKDRYRSKLGDGRWHYDRKRSKPRFRSGPLKGRSVTWDPRPEDDVWRIELQYKGERHFCDKPRDR